MAHILRMVTLYVDRCCMVQWPNSYQISFLWYWVTIPIKTTFHWLFSTSSVRVHLFMHHPKLMTLPASVFLYDISLLESNKYMVHPLGLFGTNISTWNSWVSFCCDRIVHSEHVHVLRGEDEFHKRIPCMTRMFPKIGVPPNHPF